MRWELQYASILRQIVAFGATVPSRDGTTKELSPVYLASYVPGWREVRGRGGSGEFARLEQLCYLAGEEPDVLAQVVPRYRQLAGWQGRWPGAYGPRLAYRLPLVIRELAERPWSRRAVASVWLPADLTMAVDEPEQPEPCTLTLQFFVRNGMLNCHAMMRSCDAWYGLYYDLPAFMFLARCVGLCLELRTQAVHLTATSLHLYERDWDKVQRVKPETIAVVDPFQQINEEFGGWWRRADEPVEPTSGVFAVDTWSMLVAWARRQLANWKEGHPA